MRQNPLFAPGQAPTRIAALILAGLVALAVATGVASAKPKPAPKPDFATAEEILAWINGYRLEPEPKRLPDAVHAMDRLGLLRDMDTAGVYIGFVAGVLGDNQLQAEKLVAALFPLPPEEQPVVIKGIAYSGLPGWKELLKGVIERMPARRVMIDKYLYGNEPSLLAVPMKSGPATLDALWGYYFATGSFAPVQRLVGVLDWTAEKKDVEKLTIGSMAKWTLAANAARDKELLDLLRSEFSHQPKAIAEPLQQVITAAESYETTKIRKDALAAIEELKRTGPPKESTWTQWGMQAAPTVLAVGCVAASAAGQVEVGVPCLVGGALSNAVSKLWTTNP
jgi:hypothetical protein